MRVTILHPDLGIGGAERLIVDAAVALQQKGHQVKVVTNHYDPTHAFKETELLDIEVIKWFPRNIFGSMWAFCAYIRMCLAALYVCYSIKSDVIVSDQVSASLLPLRLFSRARLIFYCHFPDLLLTDRATAAKSIYRFALDWFEEFTTGLAHVICVNSLFTASVVRKTFKSLSTTDLTVVYPTLNTRFFDETPDCQLPDVPKTAEHVFTSLNRFEVKKNVKLALEAFAELKTMLSDSDFAKCHLVVAGGYDTLNEENIAYHSQLVKYAEELDLSDRHVTFMKSPSDQVKVSLLRRSRAILYTPHNEHFGIVPVEAMYLGVPIVAVNSGGPKESICHQKTGFLVEQDANSFASCMARLVREPQLCEYMANQGPERVRRMFAFETFATRLDRLVKSEPLEQ